MIMIFIIIFISLLKIVKLITLSWLVIFSPILITISLFILLFGLIGTIEICFRVYKSAIGYNRRN